MIKNSKGELVDFNKELIDSADLDIFLKKNMNVHFEADHGVGKTASGWGTFMRNGMKSMYFAGATLDAHIDVVGIPRIIEKDGMHILELIQREYFADGSLQAIFIDELNRAPKKVRNALMELIQFKTINGKPLPNLKVVWAAINDNTDTYDIEDLDPALRDRFPIKRKISYDLCPVFFKNRYGLSTAKNIFKWWYSIPADIRNPYVSPRLLTHAIDFWIEGGKISDVLSEQQEKLNLSYLLELLNTEPIEDVIQKLVDENDVSKIKAFINNDNNFKDSIEFIKSEKPLQSIFLPKLSNEKLASNMLDKVIADHVLSNYDSVKHYKDIVDSIIKTNSNATLSNSCKKYLVKNNLLDTSISTIVNGQVNEEVRFYHMESKESLSKTLTNIEKGYDLNNLTFSQREKIWSTLLTNVPECMLNDELLMRWANVISYCVKGEKSVYPWKKYDKFIPLINHVCKQMFAIGHQPSDIRAFFPFYEDMKDSDIEDQLYVPVSKFKPREKSERFARVGSSKIKNKSFTKV